MKKVLIALFLMIILAFSIVGLTNHSSKHGIDVEQQQEAVPQNEDHSFPWK